ncbi:hypothetical protein P7L78_05435 [Tistrella bauzanensis]|uniref:hypothetical protein n=1 Tax=Tistrella TaxID=171436 RepID=UPI0031F70B06
MNSTRDVSRGQGQPAMNPLAAFHLRAAAVYAVIGMVAGITMSATHQFEYGPAHAHLNLLGFVAAALYGLLLKDRADLAATRLARLHAGLAHAGMVVMIAGLVILFSGNPGLGEPLAKIGSAAVVLGAVLFVALVFRATARRAA